MCGWCRLQSRCPDASVLAKLVCSAARAPGKQGMAGHVAEKGHMICSKAVDEAAHQSRAELAYWAGKCFQARAQHGKRMQSQVQAWQASRLNALLLQNSAA